MFIATERQQRILELLQVQKTLKIKDLVEQLRVSPMTIHRDLRQLDNAGLAKKVHGGVTRVRAFLPKGSQFEACSLCNKPSLARTAFIIHGTSGEQLHACCSHCGLLLLSRQEAGIQALTTGFLYGQIVSAQQATYLVESSVVLCCVPSVLSFSNQEDARRFQQGFGGQVMDLRQAQQHLHNAMAFMPKHHHFGKVMDSP